MSLVTTIASALAGRPDGLTLDEIEAALAQRQLVVGPSVVESLLALAGDFAPRTERWYRKSASKTDAVVEALRQFSRETGRRIFKVEAALRSLPPEQQPTREELAQIALECGEFETLKNDMIRRKE